MKFYICMYINPYPHIYIIHTCVWAYLLVHMHMYMSIHTHTCPLTDRSEDMLHSSTQEFLHLSEPS